MRYFLPGMDDTSYSSGLSFLMNRLSQHPSPARVAMSTLERWSSVG